MTRMLGGWRRIPRSALLFLLHIALLTFGLALWGLFFNLAILSYGFSRATLGWLNSGGMVATMVLSLPLWSLLSRIGLRWSLVLQGGLYALGALLMALWPSLLLVALSVIASGAAAVLLELSALPFMMRHSTAESRAALFSARSAIAITVSGLGALIGGFLPETLAAIFGFPSSSPEAYQATFGVAAAVIAVALLPLLLIRDSPVAEEPSQPTQASFPAPLAIRWRPFAVIIPELWRGILRHPWPVVRLLLPPFLVSWGAALLIPYLNLFFKDRFAVSDTTLGMIFAVIGVVTGVATMIAPSLAARFGLMRAVVLTQLLSLPFLLTMGFAPILGGVVVATWLRAALFNMGSPLYQAHAMEQTDERIRPAMAGLLGAAESIAYIVLPPISLMVQERYGFTPLFVITALCYSGAVLANYLLFLHKKA